MADKTAKQTLARITNDTTSPADIVASQLSALVDGELADAEIALVLRRLSRDHNWQMRWERYHLTSDVLQGHIPAALDTGFVNRIHEAIAREPLPASVARSLPTWYKPVTGFALAASVVLVALLGLKLDEGSATLTPTVSLAANVPSSMTASPPAQVASLDQSSISDASEPVDEARLNSYLVNHNGYASRNSMNGMLPYVRMVGYPANR